MKLQPTAIFTLMILSVGVAVASIVGESLPALKLDDAHGKAHTLGPDLRRIYATADRRGDTLMQDAMDGLKQADLDTQVAAVIADISGAPFFIKGFIRSSLRDRKYSTWLDSSGDTRKVLPYRENHVAIIDLDQMKVTGIRYAGTLDELRIELSSNPAAPSAPSVVLPPAAIATPTPDAPPEAARQGKP